MVKVYPGEIEGVDEENELKTNIQRLPTPILSSMKSVAYFNAIYDEFNKQYEAFISNKKNISNKESYTIKLNNNTYIIARHLLYYAEPIGNLYTYVIHLKKHERVSVLRLAMDTYKPDAIILTLRYFASNNQFLLEFYSYDDKVSSVVQAKFEDKWIYDELLVLMFLVKWNNNIEVFPPNNSTLRIKYNQIKGNIRTEDSTFYDRMLVYDSIFDRENINFKNYFKKVLVNNEHLTNRLLVEKPSSQRSCETGKCVIMGGTKKETKQDKNKKLGKDKK